MRKEREEAKEKIKKLKKQVKDLKKGEGPRRSHSPISRRTWSGRAGRMESGPPTRTKQLLVGKVAATARGRLRVGFRV